MTRVSRKLPRKGVYQPSTHLAAVLLVLIVFISAAAVMMLSSPGARQDDRVQLDDLAAGRDRWAVGRPDAFRYVVERSCACSAEHRTAYVATEGPGQRNAEFRVPVESADGEFLTTPPAPVWIDDLFERIETALVSQQPVTARYDANLGYPNFVAIGDDAQASDAAERYSIRDFEVLRDWAPD